MNKLTKTSSGAFIGIFNKDLFYTEDFEKEGIFILDTYIAGTSYVDYIYELEPFLDIGNKLFIEREYDNLYDSSAIAVKNSEGLKLGYIPMKDNVILARLIDGGRLLYGRITDKEYKGMWLKISIIIFMI